MKQRPNRKGRLTAVFCLSSCCGCQQLISSTILYLANLCYYLSPKTYIASCSKILNDWCCRTCICWQRFQIAKKKNALTTNTN